MCLPILYNFVRLHSYDYIRFSPETSRPEGCGGGSPFSSGYLSLITRNVVNYVKTFELLGEFKDPSQEEHARVGRIADGGMMVNLLTRAAIDRMPELTSFR